ncbi:hypothetical protein PAPYR_12848 [Paratrimastix pyriformis]|uniref:Uncharacterized protein n=1 Tax=Paratrimastix pyriformis TaxID=342808 RepID=A0ABQ8U181_9EUKA|nr:hypothetical protein PAPYR_12848 [Paratrimastix pyriformis]
MTQLRLYKNQIGDEGARALAAALPQSGSLTELDLRTNQIGDEGARAFAAALPQNSILISLYLNGANPKMGAEAVRALAAALQSNRTIKDLYLPLGVLGSADAEVALMEDDGRLTFQAD